LLFTSEWLDIASDALETPYKNLGLVLISLKRSKRERERERERNAKMFERAICQTQLATAARRPTPGNKKAGVLKAGVEKSSAGGSGN
jgi:hypothetical protein